MLGKNKGQSTLEYIAVFVAIVAAIALFTYSKISPAVQKIMDSSATKINTAAGTFTANNQ
jgi:phosphoglycerate-specific signal transduction histidine kinase